jgi:hypothetical protein
MGLSAGTHPPQLDSREYEATDAGRDVQVDSSASATINGPETGIANTNTSSSKPAVSPAVMVSPLEPTPEPNSFLGRHDLMHTQEVDSVAQRFSSIVDSAPKTSFPLPTQDPSSKPAGKMGRSHTFAMPVDQDEEDNEPLPEINMESSDED